MIFLKMDSEIVYLCLFDSSEGIFERSKKLIWMENIFAHFHCCDPKLEVGTFVDISACRAKVTLENRLIASSFSLVWYHIF